MNKVILSPDAPRLADKLSKHGYQVIFSEYLPQLIPYERTHADMQCLILDDTAFVLRECKRLAEHLRRSYHVILTDEPILGKYPSNVRLNAAVIGKNVIAKTDSLDHQVKAYCEKHGYQLIQVNQGYTKCSCAIISDNAMITADNGIYNSMKETNIDILKIRQGRVVLEGADYGFIGGASGLDRDKRTLYFTGDITSHPDYPAIKAFCENHGTRIISLTDIELTDIGGMVFC